MFELFKKKNPQRQWSDFKKLDYCNICNHLQCSTDLEFGDCCPKCGVEDFQKVIARWEYCWVNCGFMAKRINHRHEIKT